jgi:Bifunctional DNA primase/polymerase, N-terminal/Primase C terminal 2 (PriCT-2)
MKNRDAALSYVQRGWLVFPVPPGTKAGYSKDKHLNDNPWGATTSEDEARKYWARLPQANIGIAMGAGSGIWDLEFDTPEAHGVDGAASLAKLEQVHGWLPPTLMFVSPSGSVHRLFRHPGGDFRIRSGALGAEYPGIDCKGDGGMSVAPPSKTKKGKYKFINRFCIAAAPPWLLDMVVGPARAPREQNLWDQLANSTKQADIAKLTLAMAMIPNPDHDWDNWNRVGMALFAATGGSAEGLKLFDAWSQRSSKYDAAVTLAKWEALDGCPPTEIGAGSIFHWAEQSVPDWQERMYYDASVIALIKDFYERLKKE